MGRIIEVRIDTDDLCQALQDRVRYWTDDSEVLELFDEYYEYAVDNGYFDGATIDIMSIVDNDYVNNTSVTTRKEYEEKREEFLRDSIQEYIKENEDTYDEHAEWVADLKAHIEDLKDEAPEWDDVECGENNIEYLDGSYVEAKTDSCMLVS